MVNRLRLAKAALGIFTLTAVTGVASAQELVIGEERIEPGVVMIFEGAVKDAIKPNSQHLPQDRTDIHIEARANWDTENIPEGAPAEGFVAYLVVTAEVRNESTDEVVKVSLTPHVNNIDNLHYARNMALPGAKDDLYRVTFWVSAPTRAVLATHADWRDSVGNRLFSGKATEKFVYRNVDFEEIANATRD